MHSKLFNLIRDYSKDGTYKIIGTATFSGLAQALIVAVINKASMSSEDWDTLLQMLVLFIILMVAYTVTRYYALTRAAVLTEGVIRDIRNRIADKIRRCSLQKFEGAKQSERVSR